MMWIKWAIYALCYWFLLIAFAPVAWNFFTAISDILGGTTKLDWQLSNITSLMVEGAMVLTMIILFFLPIASRNGKLNSSVNFFADSLAKWLNFLFDWSSASLSQEEKYVKYVSLWYNTLILFVIVLLYFLLIRISNSIANGLQFMYYVFAMWIIVSVINFITSVIENIDEADASWNNQNNERDILSKKNILTFIIIFIMLFFVLYNNSFTSMLYNSTHDIIWFRLFDGSRISANWV